MKTLISLYILALSTTSFAYNVHVNGYTTKNGTYVQGYNRSAPDHNVNNNYNSEPDSNPYKSYFPKPREVQAPVQNSYGNSYSDLYKTED